MAECKIKKWNGLHRCATTNIPKVEHNPKLCEIQTRKLQQNLAGWKHQRRFSFWKTLKSIFLTKPKSKLTSTIFKVNEEEISNNEPIANGFGQFFSSIATTQLQTLHPVKEFVLNKLKKWRATPKFSFCLITPSEICKCLKKLWRKHTD